MNKYILILLFIFCFGCSGSNQSYCGDEKLKVANEIRRKVAIELMAKTGLRPFGSGGQMMDEVKMLALAFTYDKPIEIEEGRKLLVIAVETFLSEINRDERIRPYLYRYPFEAKNVEIMIIMNNSDLSTGNMEKLCLLMASDGECDYDVRDSTTKLLKTVLRETYEEAEQKSKESLKPPHKNVSPDS